MEDSSTSVRLSPLTLRLKVCYGVGHILNDLCASMWFTYLLLYLHRVVMFSNIAAGTLMLVGQVADAIATPLVGLESDRTGNCTYGRRKIWHLVGVTCVVLSFPFIFNLCITCENASRTALFLYYAPFVVIFQFGWASTQISHLALIPELTNDEIEKTSLNAIRYAATVTSNIFVFSIVWIFLNSVTTGSLSISREDSKAFMYIVFVILGTGLLFMVIFHVGVKEPYRTCSHDLASSTNMRSSQSWKLWFKKIQFYQVALLYMSTRLVVNLSQVYLPMYVTETLMLSKETIAIMPLIVYISGFVSTFFAKPLNQYMGRKVTFSIGCIIMICACTSFRFISIHGDNYKQQFMYGGSVALGIGGSVMLITALAIISEMIGKNKETGAFVYGAMSFVDKLSNGIAVQIIQIFHPCSHAEFCCGKCAPFYRDVMTYVAGGAAILALIALLTLWKTKIGRFDKECSGQKKLMGCNQTNSSSISRSEPENGSIRNGPAIPYYPTKQSNYGSIECQNKVNGSIQQAPNACQLKKCSNIKNTGTVDT